MWNEIANKISQVTGNNFKISDRRSIGGGCINQTYIISNGSISYFVKTNQLSLAKMFAREAQGLEEIHQTNTIKVPQPVCWGTTDQQAYLVLEYLSLNNSQKNWEEMGKQLAKLHQYTITKSTCFGWHEDNTIGSTPQLNNWCENWARFWQIDRIGYQLKLARRHGGNFPHGEDLLQIIPTLLADYHPKPSLVHGDLWVGNAGFSADGTPVIFDPATYWGDREVDLAMTELFGGFPQTFYQGYNQIYPLNQDYQQRKNLYNLYHILNHFNLFGGSYQSQANSMINQLLN
jgi:fructosamine-3-kinase